MSSGSFANLAIEHQQQQPGKRTPRASAGRGGARASELDLDAFAPTVPSASSASSAGMRRIHSSPSIALAAQAGRATSGGTLPSTSAGMGRKKTSSSSDLKNVAATKAARRLARKAEAARVSRRKKKAYLQTLEMQLQTLEDKYESLLKTKGREGKVKVPHSSSKEPQAVHGSLSKSGPSSPAVGNANSYSQMFSNNSPSPHTPIFSSALPTTHLPAAASSRPPAVTLPDQFQSVIETFATVRAEQCGAGGNFLSNATDKHPHMDFLMWLLTEARNDSSSLEMGSFALPPQPHQLFHPVSALPPNPPAAATSQPHASLWFDLLREIGLTPHQITSLTDKHLSDAALKLRDSFVSRREKVVALVEKINKHLEMRKTQNEQVWQSFRIQQQEVLAATAFKQQQKQQQSHAQQQQQPQQHQPQQLQQLQQPGVISQQSPFHMQQ